jgi:UDP-N-acetylglucosamine/UDP-N-acetyl-alpha-D-glucosaminouronate 4-epimerase
MRCLVTGAAGFIGSNLSAALIAEGHQVVGLDDLSDGSVDNLKEAPEVELIEGDLRDQHTVQKAARGCNVIFHEGAIRSVFRSMEMPALITEANVVGTLHVLLAAQEESARVIFASSSSVYGDQEVYPLTEALQPRPRSPYAASKVAGEAYCRAWWLGFGVPTVSLRYFNVYGPGQDPTNEYATVVPLFIMACLKGEQPTIHGDGEQARDFTFIDDAVRANILAAFASEEAWGHIMNVGGGQAPTSINQLLALIAEITGTQPDPIHAGPRAGDVRLTQADVSLARTLIGYEPRVSLRRGMKRTVDWFRAHADRAA